MKTGPAGLSFHSFSRTFRLLTRRPARVVDSGPGGSRPCPKRRIATVIEMELGELNV